MFKRILIPLDGSLHSEQALGLVSQLFRQEDNELILLEATSSSNNGYPIYGAGVNGFAQIIPEYRKAQADDYVISATNTARTWSPNIRGYSMLGQPDELIIEVANNEDVDLIVMVTHGYDALERLLLGSVTQKVIRDAPCPVLAVRDGHLPRHMLIALDGSPFSESILDPAFELANLIKADVTLCRVNVPADDLNMREVAEIRQFDRQLADTLLVHHNSRSEFYLDDVCKRYSRSDQEIAINIDYDVDYGKPSSRLPKVAERHGCDLIAMATHGRKGLNRLFKRSVTEDVMHQIGTAMLVLHPEETA